MACRMQGGSALITEFESSLQRKSAHQVQPAKAMALPMTQEPYLSEPQENGTQDVDLNLTSLFDSG